MTLNEEHGEVTSAEGRTTSTAVADRRCQLVKLAKEFDELDIGGDDELLPAQGGADGTEERVLALHLSQHSHLLSIGDSQGVRKKERQTETTDRQTNRERERRDRDRDHSRLCRKRTQMQACSCNRQNYHESGGKEIVVVQLDVKKAFDHVHHRAAFKGTMLQSLIPFSMGLIAAIWNGSCHESAIGNGIVEQSSGCAEAYTKAHWSLRSSSQR